MGTPGGAEALVFFHQLLHDEWMTGSLSGQLASARGGVAVSSQSTQQQRKHRNLSHVEQEGLPPMPRDRGAEQGRRRRPRGVHLAIRLVAAEDARRHSRGASGGLAWTTRTAMASRPRNQSAGVSKLPVLHRKTPLAPMTRSTRCRKTEAWRIIGTWTTATSCVTHSWSYLSAGPRRCQRQSRSGTPERKSYTT